MSSVSAETVIQTSLNVCPGVHLIVVDNDHVSVCVQSQCVPMCCEGTMPAVRYHAKPVFDQN